MSGKNQKIALVTGAGRGLGSELAIRLAGEGYTVAIHYRTSCDEALSVREKIIQQGGCAEIFCADLSLPEKCARLVSEVIDSLGNRLDLLINNAGVYEPVPLESMGSLEWFTGFHSTATAAFLITKASLQLLRQSGSGRIINIGDSSADRATARDMALGYHIGKTGVWMLTRSFARTEAPHGVTVNMVSPGYLENSVQTPEIESIPAGRLGTFEDIWAAVKFLIDENSSYITGTNIMVSGGWNLR